MEVGPTDEGYLGSWFSAQVRHIFYLALPAHACLRDSLSVFVASHHLAAWLPMQVLQVTGGEPGTVCVKYATLEESDGVPLVEWQPVGCLRPPPPPIAPGYFPPEQFSVGELLQLWFNDGWWECEITNPPELSKKQAKELKKKQVGDPCNALACTHAGTQR